MTCRITFIGGPGNISTQGDWFTNEGQRLELPLRVPVELDLDTASAADRKFYETILVKMRRMPSAYTIEDLDEVPQQPQQDHQQERPRRKPYGQDARTTD